MQCCAATVFFTRRVNKSLINTFHIRVLVREFLLTNPVDSTRSFLIVHMRVRYSPLHYLLLVTGINTKTDKKLKDITNKLQCSLHNRHIADYDEPPTINDENGDERIPRPFLRKITGIMVIICFVVVLFTTQTGILNNRITWAEKKLWPELLDYVGQLSNTSNQVAPIIFRISNFSKELESDSGRWSSNSFLAFEDGYEVFLIVSYCVIYSCHFLS